MMKQVLNFSLMVLLTVMPWPSGARDLPGPPVLTSSERLTQARAEIAAGALAAARASLQDAVREDPANADAHSLLGYVYRKQATADLPRAFEHYRLALRLDPRHRGAHEYIGEAYLQDHQPALALQHLQSLEQLCGNRECEEYRDLAQAIASYRPVSR